MVGLDTHVYSANHTFKAEYVQPLLFRIVQTIQSASDITVHIVRLQYTIIHV